MIQNLTIRGKTDGFGCQLNAVFSAIAFCEHDPNYVYVHTPFYSVSHGWGWEKDEEESSWKKRTNELNEFIGIPDGRGPGVTIDCRNVRGRKNVFNDRRPSNWYDEKTLKKLRNWYWSTAKPPPCEQDIVIHIRRGDVRPDRDSYRRKRYRHSKNDFYNIRMPEILEQYPSHYTIAIHSEIPKGGSSSEFDGITDNWPAQLKNIITWKLAKDSVAHQKYDLKVAFHEMVTAKVLIQSNSGFSYTAAILNENETWFKSGAWIKGQRYPLDHWRLIETSPNSDRNGKTYGEVFWPELQK